jgi:signal peptide peptidase SppA
MTWLNYPHLASMVLNTPLLCTPTLLEAVQQALMPRLLGQASAETQLIDPRYQALDQASVETSTHQGVAILPVHGILTPRRGTINAACMEVASYEKLSAQLDVALASSEVEHIVLDMNTPGGAAVGCFDLAERIYQAREQKPITALVNFAAYSAGYMLASACHSIVVSRTSGVGSIGVIAAHVDLSQAVANQGLKITTFYRGEHKNDLSPYEPLSDTAAAALNQSLDELYALFVETVARNRGLTPQAVRDTQAALYRGSQALSVGLADQVAHPQEAINQIAARLRPAAVSSHRRIGLQAAHLQMQLASGELHARY